MGYSLIAEYNAI